MAHFAQIENGVVRTVIVINNEVLLDSNGVEQESIGSVFCNETFGGEWVQTSYNGTFRKQFAGIGMIYDAQLDEFTVPVTEVIPPTPSE